jgi:chromosome segregation ATPase
LSAAEAVRLLAQLEKARAAVQEKEQELQSKADRIGGLESELKEATEAGEAPRAPVAGKDGSAATTAPAGSSAGSARGGKKGKPVLQKESSWAKVHQILKEKRPGLTELEAVRLRGELEDARAHAQAKSGEAQSNANRVARLESELSMQMKEFEQQQKELDATRYELRAAENEIERLRTELPAIQKAATDSAVHKKESEMLHAQLRQLEKMLVETQRQSDGGSKVELDRLQKELTEARKAAATAAVASKELELLKAALAEAKQLAEPQKERVTQLESELSNLHLQFDSSAADLARLRLELADARATVKEKDGELYSNTDRNVRQESELTSLRQNLESGSAETGRLRGELEKARTALREKDKELNASADQLKLLDSERSRSVAEAEAAKAQQDSSDAEASRLRAQLDEARAAVRDKERELQSKAAGRGAEGCSRDGVGQGS